MLDIPYYRHQEKTARINTVNFRHVQTHNLDHFESVGFPVRMETFQQVYSLLDSMQDGRFDRYMQELKGFSDDDLNIFIQACNSFLEYLDINFPHRDKFIPFDAMITSFATYKKVSALKEDAINILEIGPGCGYVAFFIKHMKSVKSYTQIEACESFYILQHSINSFLFKSDFQEKVYDENVQNTFFTPSCNRSDSLVELEKTTKNKYCTHVPYWKIKEVYDGGQQFDVIISNENLGEFSDRALKDYLELFKHTLNDDGILFTQGHGSAHGCSMNDVNELIFKKGFAPIYYYLPFHATFEDCLQYGENLAFFPAGVNTRIVIDNEVVKNIKVIDDFKSGEEICGHKISSFDSLTTDDTIICTSYEQDIIKRGKEKAEEIGCTFVNIREIKDFRMVNNACFIANTNKLYKNYSDTDKFLPQKVGYIYPAFCADMMNVKNAFGIGDKTKKTVLSKRDILPSLTSRISMATPC